MLQLLPAPPPPPEYCILWVHRWWTWSDPWWGCMQKSEWSGWAQFLGAMLAIGVAILLPLWNEHRTRKRDFHWAQASLIGLGIALEECRDACDVQSITELNACRLQLHRAIEDCGALRFSALTHEEWGVVVGCRNVAMSAHSDSEGITQGGNWQHFSMEFDTAGRAVRSFGKDHFKLN